MNKSYQRSIDCFIDSCNAILSKYTGDKLKSVTTTIVITTWFDLLGKAGLMSGTPRTMSVDDFQEFAAKVIDYLTTIDKTLSKNLITKSLFPTDINVYTGEIRS